MKSQLLQQVSLLDINEQIDLTEAIRDGMVNRSLMPTLTKAQKIKLNRHLGDHLANPDDFITWYD